MTKRTIRSLLWLAACFAVTAVQGQGVVAEFSGNSNTTTRELEVQAPWIMEWRVTGNYTGSVGFELMLLDGKTRMHKGVILRLRHRNNGVKLFNESGSFRFRISSGLANYSIKVQEISERADKLSYRHDKYSLG